MRAIFKPSKLCGNINVPPSKSVAHRYLLGAALTGEDCVLSGVDYSEDIMATVDCLDALGVGITTDGDKVTVSGKIAAEDGACLNCRESGSTLRFLIPIALCSGKRITFCGGKRLFERPLDVYAELCRECGFTFEMGESSLTVCGELKSGDYKIRSDVSSQFISGLIFALVYLNGEASVEIIPPFESKPYVDLTLDALRNFGADVGFTSEYKIEIKPATLHGLSSAIEGDYSNAAFLDAFNCTGSQITLCGLSDDSLQGDRVYREYFEKLMDGTPTLDVSDCPDLAPILIALAALRDGATLTGTDRLAAKESDRGASMHAELSKLCGGLVFGDNSITVPKQDLAYSGVVLDGHNDHRIVMALSVILSHIGGEIDGIEAVKKSYPRFFDDIKMLGAEVEIK